MSGSGDEKLKEQKAVESPAAPDPSGEISDGKSPAVRESRRIQDAPSQDQVESSPPPAEMAETLRGQDDGTASQIHSPGGEVRQAIEKGASSSKSNEPSAADSGDFNEQPTLAQQELPAQQEASKESASAASPTSADAATLASLSRDSDGNPAAEPDKLIEDIPAELLDHPRYRPLALLGRGGMGSVYKAAHRVMERIVALKVIRPELARDDLVERFRREIRAAAKLSHPNIVTAHDAEQAGSIHFLVIEFVDGESLDRIVSRDGAMDVQLACDLICQAADGLQHAFDVGMVHRDIKPQNLMCNTKGVLKILDFGLALLYSESSVTSALTHGGGVMGTPDYIAPEQADDAHAADIRSDIYSLGCTLHFLLRGTPPFGEGSVVQKIMAHIEKEPPSLSHFRPEIPFQLERIIGKAMSKHPNDRFQTPAEFAAALRPYAEDNSNRSESLAAESREQWQNVDAFHHRPIRNKPPVVMPRSVTPVRQPIPTQHVPNQQHVSESGIHWQESQSIPVAIPVSEPVDDSQIPMAEVVGQEADDMQEVGQSVFPGSGREPTEQQKHDFSGLVSVLFGICTLLFAWIPMIGYFVVPFSIFGFLLSVYSIYRNWGRSKRKLFMHFAGALMCSISLGLSVVSGIWLSSLM